ncbi:MAG: hypothetical protein LBD40_00885 [Puniceicoccales bacterium]|jgi:hypothetical protein|nr:hypothetical protein [Puniceicoccales bacterium]
MSEDLPHFFNDYGGLTPMAIECGDILRFPRFFTAEAFVECFQENFLRPSSVERHQCSLPPAAQSVPREAFYDACHRWGCLTAIFPRKDLKSYDAIIVYALGVEGMYSVGKYLQTLLSNVPKDDMSNIRKIFILTGSRPLTMEGEESMAQCLRERNLPDTEEWAARVLFRNFLKDFELSFEIINVPMRRGYDAKGEMCWERPNTRDTLHAFFKKCGHEMASILAISVNPFVSYQHAVGMATWAETAGHEIFVSKILETVGPLHPRFIPSRWSQDADRLMAIMLDNFARCTYEELGILKVKGMISC